MLTASIDIQNRLIYDQMGEFSHYSKYHSVFGSTSWFEDNDSYK